MSDLIILSLYPSFALKSMTQRHTVNMKYFEAASLGVPCVAWEHTLSADFVRKYGNGFVFDETVDMARVFRHYREVKIRVEEIREMFSWDLQKEAVERALQVPR